MYKSELDAQYTRERYEDYIVAARIRRLIREAHAAKQTVSQPTRRESLLLRVAEALRPRRLARI
jgi:hypothetical protein